MNNLSNNYRILDSKLMVKKLSFDVFNSKICILCALRLVASFWSSLVTLVMFGVVPSSQGLKASSKQILWINNNLTTTLSKLINLK